MKKILAACLFILSTAFPALSAQEFPEPMQPPRMVNDFAGFLDEGTAMHFERMLQSFFNETSTQIYLVTVPTLHGYDPNDYTTRLAEKWGVGMKGKDNGVMMLIKPKSADEKGEVYIAVGYGLESVLTDLQANQIVRQDLIPNFRDGRYSEGIEIALNAIMKITKGEFTADQYIRTDKASKKMPVVGLIVMIIIFSLLFGGRSRMNRRQSFGGNLPFWLLLGMLGSRGNSGSFGGFSSGGGFGGFGGGGGGSFGGGGAGGSW